MTIWVDPGGLEIKGFIAFLLILPLIVAVNSLVKKEHWRKDLTIVCVGLVATAIFLYFILLLRPTYIKVTWSYIWLENGFQNRITKPLLIERIKKLYIKQFEGITRGNIFQYRSLVIADEHQTLFTIGNTEGSYQLTTPRDQLT